MTDCEEVCSIIPICMIIVPRPSLLSSDMVRQHFGRVHLKHFSALHHSSVTDNLLSDEITWLLEKITL